LTEKYLVKSRLNVQSITPTEGPPLAADALLSFMEINKACMRWLGTTLIVVMVGTKPTEKSLVL